MTCLSAGRGGKRTTYLGDDHAGLAAMIFAGPRAAPPANPVACTFVME